MFKWVKSYYTTLLNNPEYIDPLKLIILETASIGKSYLIKVIQNCPYEITRDHNINISPIMLLTLTGVVVFNIYDSTIHLSFFIPVWDFKCNTRSHDIRKWYKLATRHGLTRRKYEKSAA